jgi:hypothetical protein
MAVKDFYKKMNTPDNPFSQTLVLTATKTTNLTNAQGNLQNTSFQFSKHLSSKH